MFKLLSRLCAVVACAAALNAPTGRRLKSGLSSASIEIRKPPDAWDLGTLSETYGDFVKRHYLPMAFAQAGFLASGADLATQTLERTPIDMHHVAAMAAVASTMSGAANAIWLRQLEDAFPGTETKEVATKTLIHAVILASIINSAYLVGVPLLTDTFADLSALPRDHFFAGWTTDEFLTLTKLEVCMFIPYNTVAFKFVPPRVRPLTHALVSATFNVAVSAVTLGYFDAWCHKATTIFA